MKQAVKQGLYIVSSTCTALIMTATPISLAAHGSDDTSSTTAGSGATTSTSASPSSDSGSATTSGNTSDSRIKIEHNTTTASMSETEAEASNDTTGKLRDQAKQMLTEKRQAAHQHSEAERQKSCTAHQAEINQRIANYSTAAQRHLGVFNDIFAKAQTFHDNKNLTVTDYASLAAAATAKQSAAQTAVDALKGLSVNIDCTQPDPASSLATVKSAVSNARTALQAYRSAIKDLIVALKAAAPSTDSSNSSTTGAN